MATYWVLVLLASGAATPLPERYASADICKEAAVIATNSVRVSQTNVYFRCIEVVKP